MLPVTTAVLSDDRAERAVLGSLILLGDPRFTLGLTARGLRPEHFYRADHAAVFQAAVSLSERQRPTDPITLRAEIERLALQGPDLNTIDLFTADVPAAGHHGEYADRVIELARWRDRERATHMLRAAVGKRDLDGWSRALADLESATAGSRTESFSGAQWGSMLFDYFSASDVEAEAFACPFPFAVINEAMGGGLNPGEVLALSGPTSHGKALAVTTPILTPSGWTTMGALRAGDVVFGSDGCPTQVVAAHEIMRDRDCYAVRFSDGAVITADADHLWTFEVGVREHVGYAASGYRERRSRHEAVTETTRALAEAVERSPRSPRVRLAGPVEHPEARLPVAPYVLGLWLGDGVHMSGAITTHADDAPEMASIIRRDGDRVRIVPREGRVSVLIVETPRTDLCVRGHVRRGRWNRCRECAAARAAGRPLGPRWNVSFMERLRGIGVLHPNPKAIPDAYLRASVAQRLALLQGLVDSDGSVDRSGAVEISSTLPVLRDGIVELVLSLGASVRVYEKRLVPGVRGTAMAWRIVFRMDLIAACLRRKRDRLKPMNDLKRYRYVQDVSRVASVPVRCITVAAADGMFLAGRELVPTHNSTIADQWLDFVADRGKTCHLYMTEMTAIARGIRYLSRRTGVPSMRMRRRGKALNERDMKAILAELSAIPYGCSVVADWNVDDIVRDALRARYDFVVVDLLHGFHYEDERGLDRLSKAMQRLARASTTINGHNGTAIVAVTHLKEEGMVRGKIPRPTIASIKGGSSIKQDADMVMFVQQEQDDETGAPNGDGELWLAKGRSSGIASVKIRLRPSRFRFEVLNPSLEDGAASGSGSGSGKSVVAAPAEPAPF